MASATKKAPKLKSVETITGMWNGYVHIKIQFLGETAIRVHVGLKDSDRIQSGESADKVISELIEKHTGYKDFKITGVKSDRKMKAASSPFSK